MIWRSSIILFIFLVFFSCREKEETKVVTNPAETSNHQSTEHVIDVIELQVALNAAAFKIIDFRKPKEYVAGHIPNALNVWRSDIEDTSYSYGGMAADKSTLETLLSNLGVERDDIIIIYDDKGLCDAARLWWVLKTYNFNTVKLLNGGWADWKNSKGEVSTDIPTTVPSKFKFDSEKTQDYLITKDELQDLITQEALLLIDTRTSNEFSGKRQKSGVKRGGRIPKSVNIDWMKAMDMNHQRFKSRDALEKIYAQVGTQKNKPVVAYCHTGVRSAHTTFVLTELLGFTNVKNYDGSWSEWSYFDELPIEKDSVTIVLK